VSKKLDSHKKALTEKLAELTAKRQQLGEHRKTITDRARAQHDSMGDAVNYVGSRVDGGQGGILGHRYHKTLLTEQSRLRQLIDGERPVDADDADPYRS